ncbi:MAG: anti-sigma factor [Jatrophihabitantaceae bacterium]
MPSPRDPHDPRFDLDRQDNLTLIALGERVDDEFVRHQTDCPRCQAELAELTATVRLARLAARDVAQADPPARLWNAIAAEVAAAESADPTERVAPLSPIRPARRWQLALAAAAAVLVAASSGFLIGRHSDRSGSSVAANAKLVQQPGGPADVSGAASVIRSGSGLLLKVSTSSLPYRTGYYAVWVYDPAVNRMINVGALDASGRGTFTLPAGVDIRNYDVVDVSEQDFDGNPAHKQSVLQGGLTQ